ncbi:dTDP-4-dehydrorhamnose 3,5-epimerase [Helicobacter sp. 11S03491-1]|uniref:dTDP-4-dehydrorhamnose 3,5-epimerase n=1 Tax=Helicobacter sp. 11S03491-1 TaxID=1476196 RepID=UPI000BA7A7DF|nr:dTDP-4-dehydrorhamnose 3,5-epimerase [Helicobacter sp. 11S03491-1]PAF41222.1 dTDP-4-dehydrorhamnose 3,5-epimerase [Helicobacter sp. 11S03491-1]
MNRFEFSPTSFNNLYVISPQKIQDHRGYFERYFCSQDFQAIGLDKPIVQINHSLTQQKGSIRGLHYQKKPFCETKIIRCLRGKILDVALDIRKNSPTFLQYFAIELTQENSLYLYIPEGFAHGFQSLSDEAEILYLLTAPFSPQNDQTLNPLDPIINIQWQLKLTDISHKDKNANFIDCNFKGIEV